MRNKSSHNDFVPKAADNFSSFSAHSTAQAHCVCGVFYSICMEWVSEVLSHLSIILVCYSKCPWNHSTAHRFLTVILLHDIAVIKFEFDHTKARQVRVRKENTCLQLGEKMVSVINKKYLLWVAAQISFFSFRTKSGTKNISFFFK